MSTQSLEVRDSVIRTALLPLVVTFLADIAFRVWGVELGDYHTLLAAVVGYIAYTVVRFLEVYTSPKWGYILGLPKAPHYSDN